MPYNKILKYRFLKIIFTIILFFLLSNITGFAQKKQISITVIDLSNKEKIDYALTALLQQDKAISNGLTDNYGEITLRANKGLYILFISKLGYLNYRKTLVIKRDTNINIILKPQNKHINDVIITARERRKGSSVSVIDSTALSFLQPSSFSDILELLPGGIAHNPDMGGINNIHLREVGTANSRYQTGSLGTSFNIDGSPIPVDGSMQMIGKRLWNFAGNAKPGTENIGKGLDMRAISTGDISSVEIVRGIPSASQGNITSGVVKIKRRTGGNDIRGRFKADMTSKLFYAGIDKTLLNNKLDLNTSINFLDSRIDPRNLFKNFQRLTGSFRIRYIKNFNNYRLIAGESLDYGRVLNESREDDEILINKEDSYKASNSRISSVSNIRLISANPKSWIKSINLFYNLSIRKELIKQVRKVGVQGYLAYTTVKENAESEGIFPDKNYIGILEVDGKPINQNLKFNIKFNKLFFGKIEMGIEWNYIKNIGKGQVYDLKRPPLMGLPTRPRPFYDIPATNELAFYIEDDYTKRFGNLELNINIGSRFTKAFLSHKYLLDKKIIIEPRLNLNLDYTFANGLNIETGLGYGILSLIPPVSYLYPNKTYIDIDELNYVPSEKSKRRIHFKTFVFDATNYQLGVSTNKKTEFRFGIRKNSYNLNVSLFREDLNSGLRSIGRYEPIHVTFYEAGAVKPSTISAPPELSMFPAKKDTILINNSYTANGSRTLKQGIEWIANTPRFNFLNLRLTTNGAYFKTTYQNSLATYWQPNIILDGKTYPYIGLYKDNDGYSYSQLTTSLMADTYIPDLGLIMALTFQSNVFYSRTELPLSILPINYVDYKGIVHPYTTSDAKDATLQHLHRTDIRIGLTDSTIPFEGFINFKATKELWNRRIMVALFVNRLVNIQPDYKDNGILVRRSASPYFGMELNIRL